jgi:hypothetical protein
MPAIFLQSSKAIAHWMNASKISFFITQVLVFLGLLCPRISVADVSSDVKFTLYRRHLDDCIFRIKNRSAKVVELDGTSPSDSGRPFQPAYPRLEGYVRGELSEAHPLGGVDVLPCPYPLRPGETVYFQVRLEDDRYLKNSTSAKLRLGDYVSSAFPIRKASPADVDFRQSGRHGINVLFRIQNNNETAIPLPSLDPGEDKDEPSAVAEFEVQVRKGMSWVEITKANNAAANPYSVWLQPKDAMILKVPKASFSEFPTGSVLRMRIGDFITKPFEIQ